jgi:hypothetical protein
METGRINIDDDDDLPAVRENMTKATDRSLAKQSTYCIVVVPVPTAGTGTVSILHCTEYDA